MSPTLILIVGAGISGLTLAQGLQRYHVNFTVFEQDALLDSQLQGYRIKILSELKTKLQDLLSGDAWAELEATCAETHLGETTRNATDASIVASRRGQLPKGALMHTLLTADCCVAH
ncbi:hypothetical protein MMC14_006756 [Varicellaria rhodocarpa]|nr:hypothetical protein [Varicellaria rhodocarpa]